MKNNSLIIIDSGIDLSNEKLMKKVIGGVTIHGNKIENEFNDENGHGTAVAYMASKYNKDINLYIIKIFGNQAKCKISDLIKALEYTLKIDIKTICLSLSTYLKDDKLYKVCNDLIQNGKIIISSLSNDDAVSFPAMYPRVIGVRNSYMENENIIWFDKLKKVQVVVDGTPVLTPYLGGRWCLFGGNSKAAPIIASKISKYIGNNNLLDFSGVEEFLGSISIKSSWENSELNKNISYQEKKIKDDKRKKIITNILKDTLHLSIENSTMKAYKLYEIGLNKHNVWDVIKALQYNFNIKINYNEVSLRDFKNLDTIINLICRNSERDYEK